MDSKKKFPKTGPQNNRRGPISRTATADQHSPIWKRLMVESSGRAPASVRSNSCPDLATCVNVIDSRLWKLERSKIGTHRPGAQNCGNNTTNSSRNSPDSPRRSFGRRQIIDVRNMTSLQGSSASNSSQSGTGSRSFRNTRNAVNGSDPKSITASSQGDSLNNPRTSQMPQPGVTACRNRGRRGSKSLDEELAQLKQLAKRDFGSYISSADEVDYLYNSTLTTNEIVRLYLMSRGDSDDDVNTTNGDVKDSTYNPAEDDPEMFNRCQKWLQGLEVDDSEDQESFVDSSPLPMIDEIS